MESNFSRHQKKKKTTTKSMDYAVLKLPLPVKELEAFESELIELVKNIKFRKIKNQL